MSQAHATHNQLFSTTTQILHILKRRKLLKSKFDLKVQFSALEETCVPSYCHGNWLAAYAAWWRLFTAVKLASRFGNLIKILDFGAGCGELRHLLPKSSYYYATEENTNIAQALCALVPDAKLVENIGANGACYDVVFALDCLEHNEDPESIIKCLYQSLKPGGILILSGPTENFLYKLGRYVSGFRGEYHTTDIYRISTLANKHLACVYSTQGPWRLPLFLVSVWQHP